MSAKVQHAFSKDFWVIFNGTFTYSKAIYKELEEAFDKPRWQWKTGHELSQEVGYIAEGLFRDQAEIDNSPQAKTTSMPGDIRYRDVNGDGVIDIEDAVHIGFPTTPRFVYGFSGFINYKIGNLILHSKDQVNAVSLLDRTLCLHLLVIMLC